MPREAELPEPLRPLVRRQGLEISNTKFATDMFELISTLERVLASAK
jgi:hypothetical protein